MLQQYDIYLIAVDRPGVGLSTYNPNNSFQSFAADVQQLATYLHITGAGVLGWSGAGPFALSLAFHYPELINKACLIATFTKSFSNADVFKALHANKYYFGTARYVPWLLRTAMNIASKKPADKPMPKWLSGPAGSGFRVYEWGGIYAAYEYYYYMPSCALLAEQGAVVQGSGTSL